METTTANGSLIDVETWLDVATPEELSYDPVALESGGNLAPTVRDVAITTATPSKTIVGETYVTTIDLTVENQGTHREDLNVTVFANETQIWSTIIRLDNSTSTPLSFGWNTTDFDRGSCTLVAEITALLGETDTSDNMCTAGSVLVTIAGDTTGDGVVDIYDLSVTAKAYGRTLGEAGYNPEADVTEDWIVDIRDIAVVCKNYGRANP